MNNEPHSPIFEELHPSAPMPLDGPRAAPAAAKHPGGLPGKMWAVGGVLLLGIVGLGTALAVRSNSQPIDPNAELSKAAPSAGSSVTGSTKAGKAATDQRIAKTLDLVKKDQGIYELLISSPEERALYDEFGTELPDPSQWPLLRLHALIDETCEPGALLLGSSSASLCRPSCISKRQPLMTNAERVRPNCVRVPENGNTKSFTCSNPLSPLTTAHWAFVVVKEQ